MSLRRLWGSHNLVKRGTFPAICSHYRSSDRCGFSTQTGGEDAAVAGKERQFFPRRALMYVPACDERKTSKAASLNVDSTVFDLEDGVAANQKVRVHLEFSHGGIHGNGSHLERQMN